MLEREKPLHFFFLFLVVEKENGGFFRLRERFCVCFGFEGVFFALLVEEGTGIKTQKQSDVLLF